MLDLSEQDGLERRLARDALLARPAALQDLVVAIGEEGLRRTVEHRLKEMRRAETVVQKHAPPLREALRVGRELVQPRQIRRI